MIRLTSVWDFRINGVSAVRLDVAALAQAAHAAPYYWVLLLWKLQKPLCSHGWCKMLDFLKMLGSMWGGAWRLSFCSSCLWHWKECVCDWFTCQGPLRPEFPTTQSPDGSLQRSSPVPGLTSWGALPMVCQSVLINTMTFCVFLQRDFRQWKEELIGFPFSFSSSNFCVRVYFNAEACFLLSFYEELNAFPF